MEGGNVFRNTSRARIIREIEDLAQASD